ncbi:12267_t:CDS:2, partial [Ambispora gerdemannii]
SRWAVIFPTMQTRYKRARPQFVLPTSMDPSETSEIIHFIHQYLGSNPNASSEEIIEAYCVSEQGNAHCVWCPFLAILLVIYSLNSKPIPVFVYLFYCVYLPPVTQNYTALKSAFKNTLIKPREDYVNIFFRYLEQCAIEWTPYQFYAPYTSLIQASGTGKSRLLRELAFEKDVLVVYICLRGSMSRGYPKRSIIADVITGRGFSVAHYLTFLLALFGVCSEFLDQQLRENAEKTCGRVFDILISDKDDETFDLQNCFWNKVMEQMKLQEALNNAMTDVVENIANRYKNLMVTLKKLSNPSPFKMLLAFDEAGVLDSNNISDNTGNFYRLQNALQAIPHGRDGCFMALFIDTLSKVYFPPAPRHDPSSRPGGGETLYKPFYLLDVFDCHMQQPVNITVSSSINQIRNIGRPLWAAIDEEAIIEFAMEKILCNREKVRYIYEKRDTIIETVTEALAILGPRLYLEISSLSQQASKLVSSHMRILRHVDEERESLVTTSPSEPILAEAASHIMNYPGIFVQVLNHLVNSIRSHVVVNAGDQGELVGRILCLLAVDKAIQSKYECWNMYSQSITVQEFLDALVGSQAFEKLKSVLDEQANSNNSVMLRNSKIRFNHFVYVDFTSTRMNLIDFFFRGAAILCKRNQKGTTDLIIPIAMVQDDETPVTENNLSFISIRVRNRETDSQPTGDDYQFKRQRTDNIFKQTARYIGIDSSIPFPLPYLGIYMNLGVTSEDIACYCTLDIGLKTRTDVKERMGHLSIYGLSKSVYACLNDKDSAVEPLLHKLLISYVDPVEKEDGILWGGHQPSDEWIQQCKQIAKNMEFLRYKQ